MAMEAIPIQSEWTRTDRWNQLKCRVSSFRMKYTVAPGLYALGEPDELSPVFVTANYGLSFDHLRRALTGFQAWILVLDTRGINVWCAAGKGKFGTYELMKRIREAELEKRVKHRKVIVPQLGAPGIAAHRVQNETGFRVVYGPVRAEDLPRFIEKGFQADEGMRQIRFDFRDRIALAPMEWIPAVQKTFLPSIGIALVLALVLNPGFAIDAWLVAQLSGLAGALLVPALLPWIPVRSFAAKGGILGVLTYFSYRLVQIGFHIGRFQGAMYEWMLALSSALICSYFALLFTGSTAVTSMSGVKKEMKIVVPIYRATIGVLGVLFVIQILRVWIWRHR